MKDSDKCCGMAGVFGVTHTELSIPILEQKLRNIRDTGAAVVAVGCPACRMQLAGGLDQFDANIRVVHVADLIAGKVGPKPE